MMFWAALVMLSAGSSAADEISLTLDAAQRAFENLEAKLRGARTPPADALEEMDALVRRILAGPRGDFDPLLSSLAEKAMQMQRNDLRHPALRWEAALRQALAQRLDDRDARLEQLQRLIVVYSTLAYFPQLHDTLSSLYDAKPTPETALARFQAALATFQEDRAVIALRNLGDKYPENLPAALAVYRATMDRNWYAWKRQPLVDEFARLAAASRIELDLSPQRAEIAALLKEFGELQTIRNEAIVLPTGVTLPADWPPAQPAFTREADLPPPYLLDRAEAITLTSARQFFWDDFLIQSMTGMKRTAHAAVKYEKNPVLLPDRAWEKVGDRFNDKGGDAGGFAAPFSGAVERDPDSGQFRIWYYSWPNEALLYATSKDGVAWEKPALNQDKTNVLEPKIGDSHSVVHAGNADAESTYRLFYPQGRKGWTSADGVAWKQYPLDVLVFGDRSTVFWDALRQRYVALLRTYYPGAGRCHHYAESRDGVHFGNYRLWLWADERDSGTHYAADVRCHESIYLAFRTLYAGDLQLYPSVSRDGFHWQHGRTPVVAVSPDDNVWDSGNIQSVGNLFVEVDDELWIYFSGRPGGHKGHWANDGQRPSYAATGLAKIRKDGFFSIDAGESPGVLTTRPLRFEAGELLVNLDAPEGELRVEVLDAQGQPLVGFGREDCRPLRVDSMRAQVTWNEATSLPSTADAPVRLRFHLSRGRLYSFQVGPASVHRR
jgi:hypothetical protein